TWSFTLYHLYGYPVPHSVIAKYYQGKITWWWPDHVSFAKQIFDALVRQGYIILLGISTIGSSAWLLSDWRNKVSLKTAWLHLGVVCWVISYVLAYSITHIPAYKNYLFPFYAMLLLGFGLVIQRSIYSTRCTKLQRNKIFKNFPPIYKTIFILACFSMAGYLRYSPTNLLGPPNNTPSAYREIGDWLSRNVNSRSAVGAVEIGTIGYRSHSKIVDFAGLASANVAKEIAAGNLRYAITHYNPDYIVTRYPKPLDLEGGLYPTELDGGYRFRFGSESIGVFERVEYDIDQILSTIEQSVSRTLGGTLLSTYPLPSRIENELRARLSAIGLHLNQTKASGINGLYYKLVFAEGKLTSIEPLKEYSNPNARLKIFRETFSKENLSLKPGNGIESYAVQNGILSLRAVSKENVLLFSSFPIIPVFFDTVKIRIRLIPDSPLEALKTDEIYLRWITSPENDWKNPTGKLHLPSIADGQFHTYQFNLGSRPDWNSAGEISSLRIDLSHFPGTVEIDTFEIQ
ncbi:MAG: hypothetical protein KDD53_10210, partial [Bdellovibrionales bacterium]|nr:hypothetical protein [Bdellovibrionales bacterium]